MHEHLSEWWNGISLRTKITGVTTLLLTLGLLVAGVGTASVLRNYLVQEQDQKITQNVLTLKNTIKYTLTDEGPTCSVDQLPIDYYLAVVSSDGDLVCDNMAEQPTRPDVQGLSLSEVQEHDSAFTVFNEDRTAQWRIVAYLPPNVQATVLVGLPLDDTNAAINNYAATFLFFGITVVILGGALTRLLVTSTFQPLREVEDTAARFAAGDFSQRIGGATPNTEVGRLNESLNTMLSRIDSAFADRARTIDQMRRFVGDASHELRTPLVSVRGYAELYRMGALPGPEEVAQAMERIEKEAIRMGSLVEDLLELARIDEAKPLNLAAVDLVPLARDAALDAMASSPDRKVTVVVAEPTDDAELDAAIAAEFAAEDAAAAAAASAAAASAAATVTGKVNTRTSALATGPIAFAGATLARLRARRAKVTGEIPVTGVVVPVEASALSASVTVLAEENKIRQVVTNLMGNALRFTPAGSPIEIAVAVDKPSRSAYISVVDHGEGIPPQIREKIFQRFWRADSSRNRDTGGSGLGLAIVASIIAKHNGSVEVVETPGGGSTFRVRLPLHQPAPLPQAGTGTGEVPTV